MAASRACSRSPSTRLRRDGRLYVYYTDTDGNQRIVEYRRSSADPAVADPESAREVLEMDDSAPNHNGGLLLFGPDGDLYVGIGDGGGAGDPERSAQDLVIPLGKILRIDPTPSSEPYTIPAEPYAGDPVPPEALCGLRNPWRFSFDHTTGDLWIGDVGQSTFEEIDGAPASEVEFDGSTTAGRRSRARTASTRTSGARRARRRCSSTATTTAAL